MAPEYKAGQLPVKTVDDVSNLCAEELQHPEIVSPLLGLIADLESVPELSCIALAIGGNKLTVLAFTELDLHSSGCVHVTDRVHRLWDRFASRAGQNVPGVLTQLSFVNTGGQPVHKLFKKVEEQLAESESASVVAFLELRAKQTA